MVRYTAERAFLFDFSATEAVLDQFCHETEPSLPSPVAVTLLWNGGDDKKEKRGKKMVTAFVSAVGTTTGLWRTTGKELISMISMALSLPGKQQWQEAHTPWHSQHPLHMSAHCGASSCCLPGPGNLDRHRFCAGTGALSAELPATSDRDRAQPMEPTQQNSEAEECWFSAEWTVPPLHNSEKFHSRPEKGPGTKCMHRIQHQHASVDLGVRWQFSSKRIFCILDSLDFFQKSCHLSKKILTFLSKYQGLQYLPQEHHCCAFSTVFGFVPSHCPCSGNQVPQSDYTIPMGRRVPSMAPPEGVSLGHLSKVCRRGEYNHFCKD